MSKGGKYPLEALRQQRQHVVEARAQELATRRQETDAAGARKHGAANAVQRHEAQAAETREQEREQLDAGVLRAGDLASAASWEFATQQQGAQLREAEAAAAKELRTRRQQEAQSRAELARADADAEAVDKHRNAWAAERARALEAAEEEGAEEAHLARRFHRHRSDS